MLHYLVTRAQGLFGAGLAGLGLHGIVQAAVPTQFLQLIMAACTLAAGVSVLVNAIKEALLSRHRSPN